MSNMFANVLLVVISVVVPVSIRLCAAGHPGINPLLGIRTRYVMASDSAWKAGHRAAVPATYVGGAVALLLAVVGFDPGLPASVQVMLTFGSAIALLTGASIGMVRAGRAALQQLAREHDHN